MAVIKRLTLTGRADASPPPHHLASAHALPVGQWCASAAPARRLGAAPPPNGPPLGGPAPGVLLPYDLHGAAVPAFFPPGFPPAVYAETQAHSGTGSRKYQF
jgi:hypothetical protein